MASNIRAFQLTNVRMGMIDAKGSLLVKEGNLRAEWVGQAEHVQSFQLADMRLIMRGDDGAVNFKEGNLYQVWRDLPYATSDAALLNGEMPVYIP
jgi:hypothetical protein